MMLLWTIFFATVASASSTTDLGRVDDVVDRFRSRVLANRGRPSAKLASILDDVDRAKKHLAAGCGNPICADGVRDVFRPVERLAKEWMRRGSETVDTVVIGGGFGGLNMADSLLQHSKDSPTVTLIEAEPTVGGRAIDVRFDAAPDVWVGMGPWRVIFDHYLAHSLITRFQLDTMPFNIDSGANMMMARGMRSANKTHIAEERFFAVDPTKGFIDYMMGAMIQAIEGDEWQFSAGHQSFVTHLFGGEGWAQYKLNFHTHRGDYDIFSVVDELAAGGRRLFSLSGQERVDAVRTIIGGWSALADALFDSIASHGRGDVILEATVKAVDHDAHADIYHVRFVGGGSMRARNIVFSVPKSAMARIGGTVGEGIQATAGFASVAAYPVAKAAAVWKDRWWEPVLGDDKQIQGYSECFRMIPYNFPTNYSAHVVHTAYTSEECAHLIRRLADGPRDVADAELVRHLQRIFPEIDVPTPIDSAYIFHDGGWHFNWPRTMTHEQTHEWALDPLQGHTGRVMMVAEAWARARGWVEAALDLGADALERHFDVKTRLEGVPEGEPGTRSYWPATEPFPVVWPERYFGNGKGTNRRARGEDSLHELLDQWEIVLQDPEARSIIESFLV